MRRVIITGILRGTGYRLISNGQTGKRQFKAEVWTCTYSWVTKGLTELRKGKIISFFPEKKALREVGAYIKRLINGN